jgi:MoaA/NifB/PqqE/SkfB family radical SAM enzyme
MNQDIFRYRVITNLQCNQRCKFCYQTFKPEIGTDVILDINKLEQTMNSFFNSIGKLSRTTIMGGETLLLKNPHEYVNIAKNFSHTVCLVTNGKLLNRDNLGDMIFNGLDEIAISISSLKELINTKQILDMTRDYLIKGKMRVNIPRCEESSYDKLKEMVEYCLDNDYGCVVCEDLMGRYGDPHDQVIDKWKDITLLGDNHHFKLYNDEKRNKSFALFAHYSGYNKTDIIITPFGNFCDWEKYCNRIGNYNLH